MELLSHVHTLQVFLFNSSREVKPDQDCVSLQATLLCAPPALFCSWKTPHQARLYALRLSLPLLLFDYSASPRISTLPDCIQLSLPLLPLPPFHLHAFSSLSLAHDDIHTHDPNGICVPNSSVQCEAYCANNGIHGNDGSSHSSDGDKNRACNDTHETGHAATCTSGYTSDNIPKNSVHAAADDGHGNDDAHESHEHDDTHAVEGLASCADYSIQGVVRQNHELDGAHQLADSSIHGVVHQNHELDGTHELELVATPTVNKHGCHHDCVQEEDQADHPVCQHAVHAYNFCGHGKRMHGLYHKDDIEAHGTHEVRQDAASNFHGCHNGGMSEVHADSFVHGDENSVCVDNDAFKSHEHNDTNEVWHVASAASDISGCHYHHGIIEVEHDATEAVDDIHRVCSHAIHEHNNICSDDLPTDTSSVSCQHHMDGIKAHKHHTQKNAADLQNNGSSLPSEHHDFMVLDSLTHQGLEDQKSQGATIFHCKKCSAKVSKNPVRNLVQLPCFDWRDIVENWFGACCCSFGSEAEILSASFEKSLKLRPEKCLVGSSTFYVNFSDVTVETKPVILNTDNKITQLSTLHFLALGNGFMVWENQQSKYFSWLPVYCTCCASLLGAYACKSAGSGSIREGLHLFRCQITAFNADGILDDMLRYATFKELLVKELRLRTEENMSYRFLIRSLSSQIPLLQLVVLDYDSLICTGNVTSYILDLLEHPQTTSEMTGFVGEAGLQQSIKVLFLDCTGLSANEIRLTERWVKDYDAETIFMLEEFVSILKGELLSNKVFYPSGCGLSQVFHGSFIDMSQE